MSTTPKTTQKSALQYAIDNLPANAPADIVDKLNSMLAAIEKKNSADRKPSAAQVAKKNHDQELRVAIVDEMEPHRLYSADEMLKDLPTLAAETGLTAAKVNYLLRALVDDGSIVKTQEKRKTLYALAD